MTHILNLVINDFRHVFRDRMLLIFLSAPVLLICFVRFFVPYLTEMFPVVSDYHLYIMMFGCIQTSIMFGFITSFIILEEKDENVLQAIRVLPISATYFIVYRLVFATVFSSLSAFLMLQLGNIAYPGFVNSVLLSVHYGLAAPFIALIIATYAKNKVEGLAFFKGVDILILIPITAFFINGSLKYAFSIVPMFWTYEFYAQSVNGNSGVLEFCAGLVCYGLGFIFLVRQFSKRVFDN